MTNQPMKRRGRKPISDGALQVVTTQFDCDLLARIDKMAKSVTEGNRTQLIRKVLLNAVKEWERAEARKAFIERGE